MDGVGDGDCELGGGGERLGEVDEVVLCFAGGGLVSKQYWVDGMKEKYS